MNEDLDTLEEALGYLARALSRPRIWQDIQRSAKISLDRPSAHLLGILSDQAAGCRLQELAVKIGVEAPSVSRNVQRLERVKLIVRTVDPNDRRATHLRLTPLGLKTLRGLRKAKREHFKTLLSSWPAEDRKQLVQLLHRLARQAAATADLSPTTPSLKEVHL
jgi:DNA-binding MarR family transcriptional regulator